MKKGEEMGKKGKVIEEEVCVKVEEKECKFICGQLDSCSVGSWTFMESFLLDPIEAVKEMSKK